MNTIHKEIFLLVLLFTFGVHQVNPQPSSSANPFCLSTDSLGNCLGCQSGFFLNNGECYPGNPYCNTYYSNGACIDCSQGNLVNSLCLVQTSCNSIDANGNCIDCPVGF